MANSNKPKAMSEQAQAILVGAGLGVYMGMAYRPLQEPSWSTVLVLAVVVTIALTLLNFVRRDGATNAEILRKIPTTFLIYLLVMGVLQARYYALAWGGKPAVIAMTTVGGALFGWWWSIRNR